MKKNEYEVNVNARNTQFWKDGSEQLWLDNKRGLLSFSYADMRWFNFHAFELGDVRVNHIGLIIGDE